MEVYSEGPAGAAARLNLNLLAADGAAASTLERVSVVEHTRGAVRVEAVYRTPYWKHPHR